MSLHEMTPHPCACRDRALKIDIAALYEGSKIRPPQRFGCDPDFEGGFIERGYGQACAVDADTVAEVAVTEDVGGVGDSESCASIFGLLVEFGDDCVLLAVWPNQQTGGYTSYYLDNACEHCEV